MLLQSSDNSVFPALTQYYHLTPPPQNILLPAQRHLRDSCSNSPALPADKNQGFLPKPFSSPHRHTSGLHQNYSAVLAEVNHSFPPKPFCCPSRGTSGLLTQPLLPSSLRYLKASCQTLLQSCWGTSMLLSQNPLLCLLRYLSSSQQNTWTAFIKPLFHRGAAPTQVSQCFLPRHSNCPCQSTYILLAEVPQDFPNNAFCCPRWSTSVLQSPTPLLTFLK